MSKEAIYKAAREIVAESGLINLSRRGLCERVGISEGSFSHVMGCNYTDFVRKLKTEVEEGPIHPVNKRRADPELRQAHILATAVEMAREHGYANITRNGLAERAGVSQGLVTKYFPTVVQLKRAVMRRAVNQRIPEVVAQGLAVGDSQAQKASEDLIQEAIASFSSN